MPDVVLPVLNEAGAMPWGARSDAQGLRADRRRQRLHGRLGRDPPVTGTFNIASGTAHTVLQMAETLAGAFGPAAPRPIVTGEFRLGDVRHVFASSALARERLGFEARVAFEDGIQELARTRFGRPLSRG